MRYLLFIGLICIAETTLGFNVLGPNIECTVVKVHSTARVLGDSKFPKLYQSINNDPTKSDLVIAGKKLSGISPTTIFKTDTLEKISIEIEASKIELELKGKPISRNGTLRLDGKLLADVTCH
jgi:hypothetical protein